VTDPSPLASANVFDAVSTLSSVAVPPIDTAPVGELFGLMNTVAVALRRRPRR
jgi:hypothetical protein